jgi:hypothetical protein
VVEKQVVEYEQAAQTSSAPLEGAGTSQLQRFAPSIATGSPADIAALIRTHREQRDPIMFAVQQQRGNGFAQQVIAAVTSSGDDRDDEIELDPPELWKPHTIVPRFEGDPELHALAFGTKSFSKVIAARRCASSSRPCSTSGIRSRSPACSMTRPCSRSSRCRSIWARSRPA